MARVVRVVSMDLFRHIRTHTWMSMVIMMMDDDDDDDEVPGGGREEQLGSYKPD